MHVCPACRTIARHFAQRFMAQVLPHQAVLAVLLPASQAGPPSLDPRSITSWHACRTAARHFAQHC
eukprot:1149456-Pelagomonas_calceolata.AAC.3